MGCFNPIVGDIVILKFPSPCGVWVVSLQNSLSPQGASFRPLAGCGLFPRRLHGCDAEICFRPLAGCGLFPSRVLCSRWVIVSVPLRGVGCFWVRITHASNFLRFPSPCGVWVVSFQWVKQNRRGGFRPLAGCGLFLFALLRMDGLVGFRPLAGCGLFRQSCTFFLVQQEKELSTLLFYCIILADVYQ